MQYLEDKVYTKEFLKTMDKETFSLTYQMCSKNKFDTGSIYVRQLKNQEIDHPLLIAIYEERKPKEFHIYSLEVHPTHRLQYIGQKALSKFKEKADVITLCSLPESKIFYEKQGFVEQEENRLMWRKKT